MALSSCPMSQLSRDSPTPPVVNADILRLPLPVILLLGYMLRLHSLRWELKARLTQLSEAENEEEMST